MLLMLQIVMLLLLLLLLLLGRFHRAVFSFAFAPLGRHTADHRDLVFTCEAVLSATYTTLSLAATLDLWRRLARTRGQCAMCPVHVPGDNLGC